MKKKIKNTNREKKLFNSLEDLIEVLYSEDVKKRKFVESVDLDVVYKTKQKDSKETLKGSITFPNSFSKDKIIYVICDDSQKEVALNSGASKAGNEEIIKEIQENGINFDVLITTPKMMHNILKLAKILGPKGLMPNPKNGTVTDDIKKSVQTFKEGKLNFKSAQNQSVVRIKVGNLSMTKKQIKENIVTAIKSIYNEVKKFGPNSIKKITITTTMGPGLNLNINDIINYK